MALPNTRVQRTRGLASLGRSPLTRWPLGSARIAVALSAAGLVAPSPQNTPTAPPRQCAIVEAVLTPEGRVESARITKSAGKELDERALSLVKDHRYPTPKDRGKSGKLYLTESVCAHDGR